MLPTFKKDDPFGLKVHHPLSRLQTPPTKLKPFDVNTFIREYENEFGNHPNFEQKSKNISQLLGKFAITHLLDLVFLFSFVTLAAVCVWVVFRFQLSPNERIFRHWSFTRLLLNLNASTFFLFTYGMFFVYWLVFRLLAGETLARFFFKR